MSDLLKALPLSKRGAEQIELAALWAGYRLAEAGLAAAYLRGLSRRERQMLRPLLGSKLLRRSA